MSKHYTARQIARAHERQAEAQEITLQRLADWPDDVGMPNLSYCTGSHVGTLVTLEKEGLARRLPERDALGDLRFVLTDAGREKLGMR